MQECYSLQQQFCVVNSFEIAKMKRFSSGVSSGLFDCIQQNLVGYTANT
jgi:hypothetical protein